jgi:hypothetical protein
MASAARDLLAHPPVLVHGDFLSQRHLTADRKPALTYSYNSAACLQPGALTMPQRREMLAENRLPTPLVISHINPSGADPASWICHGGPPPIPAIFPSGQQITGGTHAKTIRFTICRSPRHPHFQEVQPWPRSSGNPGGPRPSIGHALSGQRTTTSPYTTAAFP